jgi:hypothetical protein
MTTTDWDIIIAARYAEETGDFSEIEKIAREFLVDAQKKWAPHEARDQNWREYHAKPWWQKIFSKNPYSGPLPGRFRAAENLSLAKCLLNDVEKRDVKSFTGSHY